VLKSKTCIPNDCQTTTTCSSSEHNKDFRAEISKPGSVHSIWKSILLKKKKNPEYHHISYYNDIQLLFCYNMASWTPTSSLSWQNMNYAEGQTKEANHKSVIIRCLVQKRSNISNFCTELKVTRMDFKKQTKLLIEQNNALCICHTMISDCSTLRPLQVNKYPHTLHILMFSLILNSTLFHVQKQNGTKGKLCSVVQRVK